MAFDFKKHWWIILIGVLVLFNMNKTTTQAIGLVEVEEEVEVILKVSDPITEQSVVGPIQSTMAIGVCSDSDGGKDYYTKGTVNDAFNKDYTDVCTDGDSLKEYYCKSGGWAYVVVHQTGYYCANGRLIKRPTCSDSDGGKDYYTKGTTTLGSESRTDTCDGDTFVKEYSCSTCDGSQCIVSTRASRDGYECSNGRLVELDDTTCTTEDHYRCWDGDIWWYDSCNDRGEEKENCEFGCNKDADKCIDKNCDDTEWTPALSGTCSDTQIQQTSNCGNTRLKYGTKSCGGDGDDDDNDDGDDDNDNVDDEYCKDTYVFLGSFKKDDCMADPKCQLANKGSFLQNQIGLGYKCVASTCPGFIKTVSFGQTFLGSQCNTGWLFGLLIASIFIPLITGILRR